MTKQTLQQPIVLKYKIKLKTGLHIGGSKGGLKIGGIDSEVVKHPITNEPYIPGSSIKGKMRALIEMIYGIYSENPKNKNQLDPVIDPNQKAEIKVGKDNKVGLEVDGDEQEFEVSIAGAFGAAGKVDGKDVKIASRIIFEDFKLVIDDKIKEYCEFDENGNLKKVRSDFYEDKAENSVPRFLSGNANPRHIERVPAGVEFEGKIVLTPVEGGDNPISEEKLKAILNEGIKLVENFGLGGGVSRGNGQVKFVVITEN